MANVTVKKHLRTLGTGTLANGAVSIAGWTPGSEVLTPMRRTLPFRLGCNVSLTGWWIP